MSGCTNRTWIERGSHMQMPRKKAWWLRVGPFILEAHRSWLRLGVVAGRPGYVGVYLGPVVLTLGKRAFIDRPTTTWTISAIEIKEAIRTATDVPVEGK